MGTAASLFKWPSEPLKVSSDFEPPLKHKMCKCHTDRHIHKTMTDLGRQGGLHGICKVAPCRSRLVGKSALVISLADSDGGEVVCVVCRRHAWWNILAVPVVPE